MQPAAQAENTLARQCQPPATSQGGANRSCVARSLTGFELDAEACLIAVGGYGRGELFPYSDVDILIILNNEASASTNRKIEKFGRYPFGCKARYRPQRPHLERVPR